MDALTGKTAKAQALSQQRRSLAELARQQGELDQATAGAGGKRKGGRALLTFLSGEGQSTFG